MNDDSKKGPTPWGSLSPAERNELGKYLPQGKMREVMCGRDGELSAFLRLLRNWWDYYRDVLQRRGRAGLREERQALVDDRESLEQKKEALKGELLPLKQQQAAALLAQGLEPGDSITHGELAEKDPYAGQLLRMEKRLNQAVVQLHDRKSNRGAQLNVIGEMLRQLDDTGEIRRPDVFAESPASSLAHKRTVSIGRALIQHRKQNDGALPDTDSDGRPFYGSKTEFKKWAGEVIGRGESAAYNAMSEAGCYRPDRMDNKQTVEQVVSAVMDYARRHSDRLKNGVEKF